MLVNTKIINNDPNYIENHKTMIDKTIPYRHARKKPFLQLAVEHNAFEIILYLLSFKNISCSETDLIRYVSQLILPSKAPKNNQTLIQLVKLLIQHENFNYLHYSSIHCETILEYTLMRYKDHCDYFFDFELKEQMIQLMISFCDSLESKQERIDFINGNNIDFHQATALHVACKQKDFKTIDILLKNEYIDINVRDEHNNTPFMTICTHESWECQVQASGCTIIESMFSKDDFDIFATNHKKETCLILAIDARNEIVVKIIGEYLNKEYGKSNGHKTQVKKFLQHKRAYEITNVPRDAKSIAAAHNMSPLYNRLFAHLE